MKKFFVIAVAFIAVAAITPAFPEENGPRLVMPTFVEMGKAQLPGFVPNEWKNSAKDYPFHSLPIKASTDEHIYMKIGVDYELRVYVVKDNNVDIVSVFQHRRTVDKTSDGIFVRGEIVGTTDFRAGCCNSVFTSWVAQRETFPYREFYLEIWVVDRLGRKSNIISIGPVRAVKQLPQQPQQKVSAASP